jgi:hypothetical protein
MLINRRFIPEIKLFVLREAVRADAVRRGTMRRRIHEMDAAWARSVRVDRDDRDDDDGPADGG